MNDMSKQLAISSSFCTFALAAMALFARVLHDAFGNAVSDWSQIIALLSVLSMFLGAVAAIGQTDIKRLMAYSSIAHMGFALMGLLNSSWPLVIAIAITIACSFFVQGAEGATFGIIPSIKRRVTGQIAGMAGAYGNVGAVFYLFIFMFQ